MLGAVVFIVKLDAKVDNFDAKFDNFDAKVDTMIELQRDNHDDIKEYVASHWHNNDGTHLQLASK